MNQCEAHLRVTSRVINLKKKKNPHDGNLVGVFFRIKRLTGECNVRMSPDGRHSNPCFLQMITYFELKYMNIRSRHFNSNFAHYCYSLISLFGVNWKLTSILIPKRNHLQ